MIITMFYISSIVTTKKMLIEVKENEKRLFGLSDFLRFQCQRIGEVLEDLHGVKA